MEWVLGIVLFSAVVLTFVIPKAAARKARRSHVDPPAETKRVPPDELRRRLLALGGNDSPYTTYQEDDCIYVTWDLPRVAAEHPRYRDEHEKVHMLELEPLENGHVHVRLAEADVQWDYGTETAAPMVDWIWPLAPDFGPLPASPHEQADVPGDDDAHTLAALVRPVRHVVLEAGYAWDPTLEREPVWPS